MWRFQDEQAYLYAQWLRDGAGNNNKRLVNHQEQKQDQNHEQNHTGEHRRLIMV